MSELHVDEVNGASFSTDLFKNVRAFLTGIWYRIWGSNNATLNIIRMIFSIDRAVCSAGGGRVYKDSTDSDTQFSVSGLTFQYRGQLITIAEANNYPLSYGDVAHYIYADSDGTISAVQTAWPGGPHVRLGILTPSGGKWTWDNFVDHRHGGALRVLGEPKGANHAVSHYTANDSLTTADLDGLVTNQNATSEVILNLPSLGSADVGLPITGIVMETQYLTFDAPAGVTIRVGGNVTASGGTIKANTKGNTVRLVAVTAAQWVASNYVGTWTVV